MESRVKIFVVLFCGLNLALPILFVDLYPFTAFPMFSEAPRSLFQLRAKDQDGNKVELREIGLQPVYLGNPNPRIGIPVGVTPNDGRKFIRDRVLRLVVGKHLVTHPSIKKLTVVQEKIGTLGQTVGVVEARITEIDNPGYEAQ